MEFTTFINQNNQLNVHVHVESFKLHDLIIFMINKLTHIYLQINWPELKPFIYSCMIK